MSSRHRKQSRRERILEGGGQFRLSLEAKRQRREDKVNRRKLRKMANEEGFDMTTTSTATKPTTAATSYNIPVIKAATASPLMPHKFEPKNYVQSFGVESKMFSFVGITPTALDKMSQYVRMCSEEIGWLGTVREEGDALIIDEVYLFEQEVSAAQTDLDENAMASFAAEWLERDPEAACEGLNRLRMWGHSHVNMEVNPSGTDDNTMKAFAKDIANTDKPYFIRLIANKKGKMKIDIYYYQKSLYTCDVPWGLINDVEDSSDAIYQEMVSKVKRRSYTTTKTTSYSHGHGQQQQQGSVTPLVPKTPDTKSLPKPDVDKNTNKSQGITDRDAEDIQDFYERLRKQGYEISDDTTTH